MNVETNDFHTTICGRGVCRMIEFAVLPTALQAALVVMLVLVEAIGLYVGYGLLEERIAPSVLDAIANSS